MTRFALAAIALFLAGPAAARADQSFPGPAAQTVVARGERVVYLAGASPGIGRLRSARFGGQPADLPGVKRGEFKGVDLGTDRRGRDLLVYSRCGRRSCDVFSYRFDEAREHRVPGASLRACEETRPRVDRGAISFVRQEDENASRRCPRGLYLARPGRRARRIMRVDPFRVRYDYSDGVVALVRTRDLANGLVRDEIRLLRPGHRHSELVDRTTHDPGATTPSGPEVGDPQLDGGFVYWSLVVFGDPFRQDVLRRPIGGGATQALDRGGRLWIHPPGSDAPINFYVTGDRLYYAFDGNIGRVDPPPLFR